MEIRDATGSLIYYFHIYVFLAFGELVRCNIIYIKKFKEIEKNTKMRDVDDATENDR